MSKKFKPRKQKGAPNPEVLEMLLNRKGGPMTDARYKKNKNDREWKDEIRDYSR